VTSARPTGAGLLRLTPWVIVIAIGVGVSTGNAYLLTVGIVTVIWAILATGLNLLMGYTGLIHLGLGAFYALGAYGTAILTVNHGWPIWSMLVVMPVLGFVAAVLVGPPLLRTRGLYFAVATLGLGIIVSDVTGNWISVTGGPLGLAGIERPAAIGAFDPSSDRYFLLMMVVILLLCVGLASLYHRSRIARVLIAARDDELLASSLGFSALPYRIFAFAASSSMAALAGVLYAWFIRYISPPPFTFFALSFQVFVLVAVGGAGSVWGPMVGAAFLTGVPELISLEAHSKVIAYGVVLLAVIVLMPRGLVPSLADRARRLRRSPAAPPASKPPTTTSTRVLTGDSHT
jgi:branched-chain amino acid transport system permease protein